MDNTAFTPLSKYTDTKRWTNAHDINGWNEIRYKIKEEQDQKMQLENNKKRDLSWATTLSPFTCVGTSETQRFVSVGTNRSL